MTKENIRLIDPYDKNLAESYKKIFEKLELTKAPTGAYTIRFLEINGKSIAIDDLETYLKKDKKDFKKLIKNIDLQLNSKELLRDPKKLRQDNGILEFKANRGHSRLFGFLSSEGGNREIIICSHGYWKTDGKGNNKKQQQEFSKAKKFELVYKNRETL